MILKIMKKTWIRQFLISFFLIVFVTTTNFSNVKALESGEKLFSKNCSACHLDGNNIIIPEKNLKKEALETNGMNTVQAVTYQIINGKNGMPAFSGRLKEEDIEEVANYILFQSLNNFEN